MAKIARHRRSKPSVDRFWYVIAGLLIGTFWLHSYVPLMIFYFDSAHHFQIANFPLTGVMKFGRLLSLRESLGQYYGQGGYELLLLASVLISKATSIGWEGLLKLLQFLMYAGTGILLFGIGKELDRPRTGKVAALAYFLFFPNFYYSTLVMSEAYTHFVLIFTFWALLYGLRRKNQGWISAGFFLIGYSVLVKVVFVAAVPLLALVAVVFARKSKIQLEWKKLVILLLLAPLAQFSAHRLIHGKWNLQSGVAIHFWDRVIEVSRSIPTDDKDFIWLNKAYRDHGEAFVPQDWWEIAWRLSDWNLAQEDVGERMGRIAWAGFKQKPLHCLLGTFPIMLDHFMSYPRDMNVFQKSSDYLKFQDRYRKQDEFDQIYRSLSGQQEKYTDSWGSGIALEIVTAWRDVFVTLTGRGISFLLLLSFVASGVVFGFRLFSSGKDPRRVADVALWLIPILVLTATSLCEGFDERMKVWVWPFIALATVFGLGDLYQLGMKAWTGKVRSFRWFG